MATKPPAVSIGRLSLFVNEKYTPIMRRALLEFMQGVEDGRTGKGHGGRGRRSRRLFDERVLEIAEQEDTLLLQSFWRDEPGWRERYLSWRKILKKARKDI
jgi:hypothetical protein